MHILSPFSLTSRGWCQRLTFIKEKEKYVFGNITLSIPISKPFITFPNKTLYKVLHYILHVFIFFYICDHT